MNYDTKSIVTMVRSFFIVFDLIIGDGDLRHLTFGVPGSIVRHFRFEDEVELLILCNCEPLAMELRFLLFLLLLTAFYYRRLIKYLNVNRTQTLKLPPGPYSLPFIGNAITVLRSPDVESYLRTLHAKYGPIITLKLNSSRPSIFISSQSLAFASLIQNSSVFANRPPPQPVSNLFSSNLRNINSSFYGTTWRILRRNLTSFLNPSRSHSFSPDRRHVIAILCDSLRSLSSDPIPVAPHLKLSIFRILVFMCFGRNLPEPELQEIVDLQNRILVGGQRFHVLNIFPLLGKVLFPGRWREVRKLFEDRERVFGPLIRNRDEVGKGEVRCYVDSFAGLELPEKRKLTRREMVSLCSEFLVAGTDTTTTALEWIMANIVKYPHVQERVYSDVRNVMGGRPMVEEEDLKEMSYVKSVVLEGLRRHPPGHFVVPHSVTEDVELGGYLIPKDSTVNFMVAEMGRDGNVWEDPMKFDPGRFLDGKGEGFDITGSKGIKMMPFGVGRRICPGLGLAMLHLEYFVANLVWQFEWKVVEGDNVDLSEKQQFTVVMKNPLQARLYPRKDSSGN